MKQLFSDISKLINETLTTPEVFYFASLLHLMFVHIHPFRDGNGRAVRLVEKWFITEKPGKEYWHCLNRNIHHAKKTSTLQSVYS